MGLILGPDKFGVMNKVSASQLKLTLHFSGENRFTIGGQQYSETSELVLDTSILGPGGLDAAVGANKRYRIYVVRDGGANKLIGSESTSGPSGILGFLDTGLDVCTNWNSEIFKDLNVFMEISRDASYNLPGDDVQRRIPFDTEWFNTHNIVQNLGSDTTLQVILPVDGVYNVDGLSGINSTVGTMTYVATLRNNTQSTDLSRPANGRSSGNAHLLQSVLSKGGRFNAGDVLFYQQRHNEGVSRGQLTNRAQTYWIIERLRD